MSKREREKERERDFNPAKVGARDERSLESALKCLYTWVSGIGAAGGFFVCGVGLAC